MQTLSWFHSDKFKVLGSIEEKNQPGKSDFFLWTFKIKVPVPCKSCFIIHCIWYLAIHDTCDIQLGFYSIVNSPSVHEGIHDHSTHLHTNHGSIVVQEIFHFCSSAKTKNLLEGKKNENTGRWRETGRFLNQKVHFEIKK